MNHDAHKEPEQLEREVRAARDQLSSTVDEISNRLSPGELLDQALDVTKGYGGEFAQNLGKQAKDNPLALMVTGVGMAWMMLGNQQAANANAVSGHRTNMNSAGFERGVNNESHSDSDFSHHSDSMHAAATSGMGRSNQSGEDFSKKMAEHIPDSDQIKDYAQSAQTQLQRTLEEQPLMAGALGVALGAALGALLPPSEVEDRFMGEKSDKATEKATEMAQQKYQESKEVLKQKVTAVVDHQENDDQSTS